MKYYENSEENYGKIMLKKNNKYEMLYLQYFLITQQMDF